MTYKVINNYLLDECNYLKAVVVKSENKYKLYLEDLVVENEFKIVKHNGIEYFSEGEEFDLDYAFARQEPNVNISESEIETFNDFQDFTQTAYYGLDFEIEDIEKDNNNNIVRAIIYNRDIEEIFFQKIDSLIPGILKSYLKYKRDIVESPERIKLWETDFGIGVFILYLSKSKDDFFTLSLVEDWEIEHTDYLIEMIEMSNLNNEYIINCVSNISSKNELLSAIYKVFVFNDASRNRPSPDEVIFNYGKMVEKINQLSPTWNLREEELHACYIKIKKDYKDAFHELKKEFANDYETLKLIRALESFMELPQ